MTFEEFFGPGWRRMTKVAGRARPAVEAPLAGRARLTPLPPLEMGPAVSRPSRMADQFW